jgi:hypothetical protein
MKKFNLDGLKVDSFATTATLPRDRGTVAGHAALNTGFTACPISYGGTCWVTCAESCYCETVFEC